MGKGQGHFSHRSVRGVLRLKSAVCQNGLHRRVQLAHPDALPPAGGRRHLSGPPARPRGEPAREPAGAQGHSHLLHRLRAGRPAALRVVQLPRLRSCHHAALCLSRAGGRCQPCAPLRKAEPPKAALLRAVLRGHSVLLHPGRQPERPRRVPRPYLRRGVGLLHSPPQLQRSCAAGAVQARVLAVRPVRGTRGSDHARHRTARPAHYAPELAGDRPFLLRGERRLPPFSGGQPVRRRAERVDALDL